MTSPTPEEFLRTQADLPPRERLQALVRVLRGPGGCAWDQKQTAATMVDFVIDEAHELKEAIQRGRGNEVVEELGDLLFTCTFLTETLDQQAAETAAVTTVVEKMTVRHPHVFGDHGLSSDPLPESEVKRAWESLKLAAGGTKGGRLDRDLPASLPAWNKALKILGRARNSGFRYPNAGAAWEGVAEEWGELQEALEGESPQRQEAELGDLLLALLTASLDSGLDCERAISTAGRTLSDRMERVEQLAGTSLSKIPYEELARLYSEARAADPGGA